VGYVFLILSDTSLTFIT